MSVFSTELPLVSTRSAADFVSLAVEWIAGMRNSKIDKSILEDFKTKCCGTYDNHNEKIEIYKKYVIGGEISGILYSYQDSEYRQWTVECVNSSAPDRSIVSVKAYSNSLVAAPDLPTPKPPHIIKMLIRRRWCGYDGYLVPQEEPIFLERNKLILASTLITDGITTHLPVVYVSARNNNGNKYIVDPDSLARKLAGMAHVVVEPDRDFSFDLAQQVQFKNPYSGAVGVYWPELGAGKRYFFSRRRDIDLSRHSESTF